ncbi:hypothetical protein SCHPADRAFT_1003064 [Schizopora paradoxa]|uniref:Uncharacterized protein n=1 Tax=Schizopora paradoxa TaxID=27342 RepID=A0A0H2R6H3_9AGAM|nr:hypothetical protein SCHPADRAFT_1003064 [Schizopora paradoxa]
MFRKMLNRILPSRAKGSFASLVDWMMFPSDTRYGARFRVALIYKKLKTESKMPTAETRLDTNLLIPSHVLLVILKPRRRSRQQMNSTSKVCPGGVIPANLDIEGIGTRVATYAQLLLAVLTIALSPDVSSFSSWWAVLVTSIALQLAAIAQRGALALFHMLIVTWLAFPAFDVLGLYLSALATRRDADRDPGGDILSWISICRFRFMVFVAFGKNVNPTGPVRFFVIGVYVAWGFAYIIAACASIISLIPYLRRRAEKEIDHLCETFSVQFSAISAYTTSPPHITFLVTLYNLLAVALSIWTFESMLRRNESRAALTDDDDGWTLGQISALLLLGSPATKIQAAQASIPKLQEDPVSPVIYRLQKYFKRKMRSAIAVRYRPAVIRETYKTQSCFEEKSKMRYHIWLRKYHLVNLFVPSNPIVMHIFAQCWVHSFGEQRNLLFVSNYSLPFPSPTTELNMRTFRLLLKHLPDT